VATFGLLDQSLEQGGEIEDQNNLFDDKAGGSGVVIRELCTNSLL
jgi:hypothetical protein